MLGRYGAVESIKATCVTQRLNLTSCLFLIFIIFCCWYSLSFVSAEDIKPARSQNWIEPASIFCKSIALSPGSCHLIVDRITRSAGEKIFLTDFFFGGRGVGGAGYGTFSCHKHTLLPIPPTGYSIHFLGPWCPRDPLLSMEPLTPLKYFNLRPACLNKVFVAVAWILVKS